LFNDLPDLGQGLQRGLFTLDYRVIPSVEIG
jgi:hypothetical protein